MQNYQHQCNSANSFWCLAFYVIVLNNTVFVFHFLLVSPSKEHTSQAQKEAISELQNKKVLL